jgi:hypothetical protein
MPVDEARGSMVLDIGGGTSEVAVISLNGIVYSSSVRIGGDRFDDAIINYVRRNYGTLIGETTAEHIKHEIGSAYPGKEVLEIEVKGRNLSQGIPRAFTLNSNEILESLQEPLAGDCPWSSPTTPSPALPVVAAVPSSCSTNAAVTSSRSNSDPTASRAAHAARHTTLPIPGPRAALRTALCRTNTLE